MKLGMEELEYMNAIEKVTKAHVKDCVINNGELAVVVQEGDMGLAIGRKGENAEKVRRIISKKVSFIEFSGDIKKFIRNLFAPAALTDIRVNGDTVEIKAKEMQRIIGRGGKRKKRAELLLGRHFGIKKVIVN